MPRTLTQQSYLELGAYPSAVPCARLHARNVLYEWGVRSIADTVELIVSELVTNAVNAASGYQAAPAHGDGPRPGAGLGRQPAAAAATAARPRRRERPRPGDRGHAQCPVGSP